jgi:putative endopeptidase
MLTLTRRGMSTSALVLLAGCATQNSASSPTGAAAAPRTPAAIGAWGIDMTTLDTSVSPGNDFYRYVNGRWMDTTEIPGDRVTWGTFSILAEKAEREVKAIIDELAASGGAPGSDEQKIADFYNSYNDIAAINAAGLGPAQADLDAIAALRTHADVVRMAAAPGIPVTFPIAAYIDLDERNPDRFVVHMTHAGLSLPDREFYLRDDAEFETIRTEFRAHVARLFTAAGISGGEAKAREIFALETAVARDHWPLEDRRERERVYNMRTRAQINAIEPRFPWDAWFEGAEIGSVQEVNIHELSAMQPLARTVLNTPVSTWRSFLTYQYLVNNAPVLPQAIDDEQFAFYSQTLNGQQQQRERWRRAVTSVNGSLGKAVGRLYVARHFPASAKQQMLDLVENMRRAYGERIDALTWMSPETKVVAREKLRTFLPKIGYPDNWRDYSAFDVRAGDAFGNRKRSAVYTWRYDVARLSRPTDKTEWLYMDPQDINAYYNPVFNEVVFPAAILQPPFFDPNADPAVNYGAIGGVIGHEMGHGFDDQGAKSDAQGVLRDWWNAQDVARFGALTSSLSSQYAAFEALPGLNLNGQNTLGENIGDNGGLQVAYYAYHLSLNGQDAPVLDGTTGDQRFFMSWAQAWRTKMRDQFLRTLVTSDEHSPPYFRTNGTVRNMDAWYAAFDVQPRAALYLPDDQRVEIW